MKAKIFAAVFCAGILSQIDTASAQYYGPTGGYYYYGSPAALCCARRYAAPLARLFISSCRVAGDRPPALDPERCPALSGAKSTTHNAAAANIDRVIAILCA